MRRGEIKTALVGESPFGRVMIGVVTRESIFAPQIDAFGRQLCTSPLEPLELDDRERALLAALPNVLTAVIDIKLAQLMATTIVVVDLIREPVLALLQRNPVRVWPPVRVFPPR